MHATTEVYAASTAQPALVLSCGKEVTSPALVADAAAATVPLAGAAADRRALVTAPTNYGSAEARRG